MDHLEPQSAVVKIQPSNLLVLTALVLPSASHRTGAVQLHRQSHTDTLWHAAPAPQPPQRNVKASAHLRALSRFPKYLYADWNGLWTCLLSLKLCSKERLEMLSQVTEKRLSVSHLLPRKWLNRMLDVSGSDRDVELQFCVLQWATDNSLCWSSFFALFLSRTTFKIISSFQ